MKDTRIVWSDEDGDLRKKGSKPNDRPVDEKVIELLLRRLTSGKGRAMVEITGLPANKKWCKELASLLKKSLGAGGAYKSDFIEVHVSEIDKVTNILDKKSLRWKKIGG